MTKQERKIDKIIHDAEAKCHHCFPDRAKLIRATFDAIKPLVPELLHVEIAAIVAHQITQ